MKTGTIYIIRNDVNDKVYIGQTIRSIKKRFQEHISASKGNEWLSRNRKFYQAIREIGAKHFRIEALKQRVSVDALNKMEEEFIAKYDSYDNGYNATKGGNIGHLGNKGKEMDKPKLLTEDTCKLIFKLYESGKSARQIVEITNMPFGKVIWYLLNHFPKPLRL